MIGETLGSYRVLTQLGQGGMGVVYVAEHVELGFKTAIKLLLPELSQNAEVVQRFFNEARAATLIKHPGIVQIFDFGRHASGAAYFVMELLEGQSLAGRLRERRILPPGEVASLGRQLANTLAAAHAKGIVHRDLKPDNIMLVPDAELPGGVRAKILDFGIAKLVGAELASLRTRTGSVMGTPFYMSPEQCRGAGEVDARADVYSLGCILYEMACGRPPFVGEGLGEVLGMHQFVAPVPPRKVNSSVPKPLEAAILRTLAKQPGERQQSMTELANQLAPLSTSGAMPATPAAPRNPKAPPRVTEPDPPPAQPQQAWPAATPQPPQQPWPAPADSPQQYLPPPPPGPPLPRSVKPRPPSGTLLTPTRVVIGVVVVFVITAVGAYYSNQHDKPKPHGLPIHAYADASWSSLGDCLAPTLTVRVEDANDATITVKGHTALGSYGGVDIALAPGDLAADERKLTLHLTRADQQRDLEVDVPEPPAAQSRITPSGGGYSPDNVWSGQAKIGSVDLSTDAKLEAGKLVFRFTTCGATGGSAKVGEVVVTDKTVEYRVSALDALGDRSKLGYDEPSTFELHMDQTGQPGGGVDIKLDGKLNGRKLGEVLWGDVVAHPLTEAPAHVPGHSDVIVLYSGTPNYDLVKGKLRDVELVADLKGTSASAGSCGPYGSGIGYAPRTREDAVVTLREARTGAQLAQKSFRGSPPSCPSYITTYDGHASVGGSYPEKAINAWLAAQARQ